MAQISRIRRFVPTTQVNGSNTEDAPIAVYLRSVDVQMKQAQIRKFIGMSAEDLTKQMLDVKGSNEIKEVLTKNVVRFENLEIIEEDETAKGATIQDMWELGEYQLCLELFTEILQSSQLSAREAKNSESPLGSTPLSAEEVH